MKNIGSNYYKTKERLEVCLSKKIVLGFFWIFKNTKCNSKFELNVRIIKQTNHQESAPWVTNWPNMFRLIFSSCVYQSFYELYDEFWGYLIV
jgi:hypothetical protein